MLHKAMEGMYKKVVIS